eukprot:3076919-Pleurochrysis_carterae.AAC.2
MDDIASAERRACVDGAWSKDHYWEESLIEYFLLILIGKQQANSASMHACKTHERGNAFDDVEVLPCSALRINAEQGPLKCLQFACMAYVMRLHKA